MLVRTTLTLLTCALLCSVTSGSEAQTADPAGPDAILESNQADVGFFSPAEMGSAVASAGDVNGDGFDDVIVGAYGWDGIGFDSGAAFVFLGGPNGVESGDPANAHAFIEGRVAFAEFGRSVAGAGDVNGDGFDDVIVGAPLMDASGLSVSGAAYIFHGGPGGIAASSTADADRVLESLQLEAHFGVSVSGAGDVDGDGFDDVIVGAWLFGKPFDPPIPNRGSGRQGAAFVFLGSAAGIVGSSPEDANASLRPWSQAGASQTGASFGSSVSGAGDVNGDGFDDVLVGCPQWNLARPWPGTGSVDPPLEGAAFVFLGSAAGIVGSDPSNAHARIEGQRLEAFLGSSVADAGDVNGDGFGDVIVGAVGYPAGEPLLAAQEGAAMVFLGSSGGITAASPADANFFVQGSELAEWLGRSVHGAGDLDGDGFDDVLIGARSYPGSASAEGVAYGFRGSAAGVVGGSLFDAYLFIASSRAGSDLGAAVSSAGDVDGDLFGDLIVGVPGYSSPEQTEGAAFVYRASRAGSPAPVPPAEQPSPPAPPSEAPLPPNQPPVAAAGPDETVVDSDGDSRVTITLDGSASSDPDGSIVAHSWWLGVTPLGAGAGTGAGTGLQVTLGVGVHAITLEVTDDAGATANDMIVVTVSAAPLPAQGSVAITGSSVVDRGDTVSWTLTLTNTGSAQISAPEVSLQVNPGSRVKDLGAGIVSLADVPAGGSVSHTWTGRADREGSGLVVGEVVHDGVSLGSATLVLTVEK